MSTPRTVTVPTTDHGPVTIPEPVWCAGHDDRPPGYRDDIIHSAPDVVMGFRGHDMLTAALVSYPYVPSLGGLHMGVSVAFGGFGQTLTPAELDELAAALVEHAATLRAMARELGVILARNEGQ
ncbi:DUF6907 domain-containing protein [Streptomyces sp. NPDC000880]